MEKQKKKKLKNHAPYITITRLHHRGSRKKKKKRKAGLCTLLFSLLIFLKYSPKQARRQVWFLSMFRKMLFKYMASNSLYVACMLFGFGWGLLILCVKFNDFWRNDFPIVGNVIFASLFERENNQCPRLVSEFIKWFTLGILGTLERLHSTGIFHFCSWSWNCKSCFYSIIKLECTVSRKFLKFEVSIRVDLSPLNVVLILIHYEYVSLIQVKEGGGWRVKEEI